MLPKCKRFPYQKAVFPQNWQTVIFRNYGMVSTDKIARVLGCDERTVLAEATRLGLGAVEFDARWEAHGFITLIRNNWHLLPYNQLLDLLDYDEARLEFILEKEDFLGVKLGSVKPDLPQVQYAPLTPEEEKTTLALTKKITQLLPEKTKAFDFFSAFAQIPYAPLGTSNENLRLLHGYLTPCGDAFMQDSASYLPDSLLHAYQQQGVNAVWVHGTLSTLSPYPFIPEMSKDYKLRRANLQELVRRAKRYGIAVYLYFNEPRGISEEKLGNYAHLKGTVHYGAGSLGVTEGEASSGVACLCFEQQEVQEYLYTATRDLFEEVQDLGGLITITMSENPTHCHFLGERGCTCPVCKNIPVEETVAKVNNVMAKAMQDSGSDGKLLAYLWGWSGTMGFTEEQTRKAIANLEGENIVAVCASEYGVEFEKGGVKSSVIDYSIANPGPSEITKISFLAAQAKGIKPCAKIQTNNSWECSAVPYMPVFDLVLRHLRNLSAIGVHDYMLTWTLGGYPSPMLGMVSDYAQAPDSFDISVWYEKTYGAEAALVHQAVEKFCAGFEEYPFHIAGLYNSPKTLGPANLWDLKPEGKYSTMVCYAFDDYETWISPYPYEIYIQQYEKLFRAWESGLEILSKARQTPLVAELLAYAETAYIHFKADSLQTQFSYYKRDLTKYKAGALAVLQEEATITQRLLKLYAEYPTIGFEASNHYYYHERNLIEKILQTQCLQEELKSL